MAEEKVYHLEEVEEVPFPSDTSEALGNSSDGKSGDNYSPIQTKQTTTPVKRTAVELLGQVLNTRSRKVLQSLDLEQSGGFQIGKFKEGENGDIRITPNGITGRDTNGVETFVLDSDGNLVVKGEIRSGSFITGQVIVGNNRVIIDVDENGEPRIIVNDGTNDRILIGYQEDGF